MVFGHSIGVSSKPGEEFHRYSIDVTVRHDPVVFSMAAIGYSNWHTVLFLVFLSISIAMLVDWRTCSHQHHLYGVGVAILIIIFSPGWCCWLWHIETNDKFDSFPGGKEEEHIKPQSKSCFGTMRSFWCISCPNMIFDKLSNHGYKEHTHHTHIYIYICTQNPKLSHSYPKL